MMKQRTSIGKKLIAIFLMLVLALSGCAGKQEIAAMSDEEFGFAKMITDRTLIVSVFSNAPNAQEVDEAFELECLERLDSACEFITDACKSYAADADILYDWTEHAELKAMCKFDDDFVQNAEDIKLIEEYLKDDASNRAALLAEYEAQSILYIFFFNTDKDNSVPTQCYMCTGKGTPCDEFIIMNNYVNQQQESPSAYAHEILHAFGAPDLYTEDGGYKGKITPEYVEYLQENYMSEGNNDVDSVSQKVDIMYTVHAKRTDKALSKFEIGSTTAYYLGLIDKKNAPDIEKYQLGLSTFEEYK